MEKSVHVIQVMKAKKNGKVVDFLGLSPALDSVLSSYINNGSSERATMLGYGSVRKLINSGKAVEAAGDNDFIISRIFNDPDNEVTEDEARSIVSEAAGGKDLSSVSMKTGVPGKTSDNTCVHIEGTILLGHTVRRGYTTFYVEENPEEESGPIMKYAVVNWTDSDSNDLVRVNAETGEFVSLITAQDSFGRFVESAKTVSMAEDLSINVRVPHFASETSFVVDEDVSEEDVDTETIEKDPSDVSGRSLAVVPSGEVQYDSVVGNTVTKTVDGEEISALVGAKDKGFIKEGGTVMMPEFDDHVSVINLETLFN
jgi:hypothetical protein